MGIWFDSGATSSHLGLELGGGGGGGMDHSHPGSPAHLRLPAAPHCTRVGGRHAPPHQSEGAWPSPASIAPGRRGGTMNRACLPGWCRERAQLNGANSPRRWFPSHSHRVHALPLLAPGPTVM